MHEIDFETLIEGLSRPAAFPHPAPQVERIETHISVVLLAGDFAYKIKKPVDLGFADFSTLARRRTFCDEELRLNRRLAPDYYLAVVPITRQAGEPYLGGSGEPIEYAVKMRRFPQEALLSRQPITVELVERIAERVVGFHEQIPSAQPDRDAGHYSAVLAPMLDNFAQIRQRSIDGQCERIDLLEDWTRVQASRLRHQIEQRRSGGHVRECHGDMHRGNIAVVAGEIVIFDAIEFNPSLRWIDTMSEVAFLVMDLDECGHGVLARRLLNRYLQLGGDYEGLPLLTLYKVYRAMVRAKVIAIRLGQSHLAPQEAVDDQRDFARYLALAEGYTQNAEPALILMHGLSGSGKSRIASGVIEHLDAIHIRSDIERKRLFGLPADADSTRVGDIYTPEATSQTYQCLLAQARAILTAGFHALVDATFLLEGQRRPFLELADLLGRPCSILSVHAPDAELKARLVRRRETSRDPSEADGQVLDWQLKRQESLTAHERTRSAMIDTTRPVDLARILAHLGLSN